MYLREDDFYASSVLRFGELVYRYRVLRGLSRQELAKQLEFVSWVEEREDRYYRMLSERLISRIENGEVSKVPIWLIRPLVTVLRLTPQEQATLLACVIPNLKLDVRVKIEVPQEQRSAQPNSIRLPVTLTDRELDVVRLGAKGFVSREVADRLIISKETVDTHWFRIREKTGIKDRQAIIEWAREHGLI